MKVRDILKMVAFNLQRRDIIDCLEGKNADGEEELKKLDTAEINISSTEMAKKMSETASIDDLLAMLSIGDDK